MRRDVLLEYCLAKAGAWPDEPWDGDTVVKVGPKIFAFLGGPDAHTVGLKCGTRLEADELIAQYPADVQVAAYIGRYGWNTVVIDGTVSAAEVRELVDASYDLVVASLPKSRRPAGG